MLNQHSAINKCMTRNFIRFLNSRHPTCNTSKLFTDIEQLKRGTREILYVSEDVKASKPSFMRAETSTSKTPCRSSSKATRRSSRHVTQHARQHEQEAAWASLRPRRKLRDRKRKKKKEKIRKKVNCQCYLCSMVKKPKPFNISAICIALRG